MNDLLHEDVLEDEEKAEIEKSWRFVRRYWFFLPLGQVIFVVILCHALGDRMNRPSPDPSLLRIRRVAFFIMGAFALAVSYVLRKLFFSPRFSGLRTHIRMPWVSSEERGYLVEYRQRMFYPAVIPSSLSILGFVLFVMGSTLGMFYLFIALSILGMVYQYPRKQDILTLRAEWLQLQQDTPTEDQRNQMVDWSQASGLMLKENRSEKTYG
jgi:hypothetical protein